MLGHTCSYLERFLEHDNFKDSYSFNWQVTSFNYCSTEQDNKSYIAGKESDNLQGTIREWQGKRASVIDWLSFETGWV